MRRKDWTWRFVAAMPTALRSVNPSVWLLAACVAAPVAASALGATIFQAQGEAKFSDGVSVSVVYVGPTESSTLPVWHVDGSLAGTGESLARGGRYSAPATMPGKRGVVVAFTLDGMPPHDPDADPFRIFAVKLAGESDHGGGSSGGASTVHAHKQFYVREALTLADLQIGRGFGPYQTVAENREGEGSLAVEVVPNGETQESRTVNGETIESHHSASDVKFTLPKNVKEKDWRLRAFDASGASLKIMVGYFPDMNSPGQLTFHGHCNAAPETIERFVLEARNYEWVTIKNLHLRPNGAIHP